MWNISNIYLEQYMLESYGGVIGLRCQTLFECKIHNIGNHVGICCVGAVLSRSSTLRAQTGIQKSRNRDLYYTRFINVYTLIYSISASIPP